MNNEVVDARALTRFLENRLKDLRMYASLGVQPSAACGSAIGALENVLSFVNDNAITIDAPDPLKALVEQEVPFRLSEIFCITDDRITPDIVDACVDDLYNNSDAMFDYDSIDAHIRGTLSQYGITADDMEGKTYDRNR